MAHVRCCLRGIVGPRCRAHGAEMRPGTGATDALTRRIPPGEARFPWRYGHSGSARAFARRRKDCESQEGLRVPGYRWQDTGAADAVTRRIRSGEAQMPRRYGHSGSATISARRRKDCASKEGLRVLSQCPLRQAYPRRDTWDFHLDQGWSVLSIRGKRGGRVRAGNGPTRNTEWNNTGSEAGDPPRPNPKTTASPEINQDQPRDRWIKAKRRLSDGRTQVRRTHPKLR